MDDLNSAVYCPLPGGTPVATLTTGQTRYLIFCRGKVVRGSPCTNLLTLTLLAGLLLPACTSQPQTDTAKPFKDVQSSSHANLNTISTGPERAVSSSQLKLRRMRLIRNTLAKALVLDPKGMCLELGRMPCADQVHKVSLGGIDAYNNTQYVFSQDISVAAAPALERLAMSACIQRASMDLVAPAQAVIFKNIELSVDGRLIDNDAVTVSVDTLYKRLFSRSATPEEIQALRDLYVRIYETQPRGAARNWMVLACFAVASSAESFFY